MKIGILYFLDNDFHHVFRYEDIFIGLKCFIIVLIELNLFILQGFCYLMNYLLFNGLFIGQLEGHELEFFVVFSGLFRGE